ncbi:MAG TPA: (d)CMP kinase [Gemmatimonadaceae bacterium]|nr:(d)CMP kinase [Gemmatimonadaceae bacterium]
MPGAEQRARVVIAIDGPAASGKSSTAQWVASELGFRHVDSGALYRAATAAALRTDGDDVPSEAQVLGEVGRITLASSAPSLVPLIDGGDASEAIRGSAVTRRVSAVARMPRVREWVNATVREAARDHDVVVDGRDMGTAVFPDATLKVFLVADPWERARRRLVQRLGRRPTDEEVAEETDRLVRRDADDATQTAQARDAVLIDTTYITQAEQVERIVALARAVTARPSGTSAVDAAPDIP